MRRLRFLNSNLTYKEEYCADTGQRIYEEKAKKKSWFKNKERSQIGQAYKKQDNQRKVLTRCGN